MNSPLRFFLLTALFVATLLGSLPAQAQQDYEHWLAGAMATRLGERGEWRVVMGAGAGLAPEYRGADAVRATNIDFNIFYDAAGEGGRYRPDTTPRTSTETSPRA